MTELLVVLELLISAKIIGSDVNSKKVASEVAATRIEL
jgi:hypothetical protein